MNKIDQILLRYILVNECRSAETITNLYREIRLAAQEHFTEDNTATLNEKLGRWFLDSLAKETETYTVEVGDKDNRVKLSSRFDNKQDAEEYQEMIAKKYPYPNYFISMTKTTHKS